VNDDEPIFRHGMVILMRRKMRDGSVLLYKPQPLKPHHIMKMTGAPGWDKEAVDATFPEGRSGHLAYVYESVRYLIDIERFREHAFMRNIANHGEQYHCALRWWEPKARVDPERPAPGEPAPPRLPTRLVFGEVMRCPRCKGRGQEPGLPTPCERCKGLGVTNTR